MSGEDGQQFMCGLASTASVSEEAQMDDRTPDFEADLIGRSCRISRRESDWTFDFGGERGLSIGCHWRVVSDGGIAITDEDDGQGFGLANPVEAAAKANALLSESTITSAKVDRSTADLCLWFSNGMRADVINNSSGYEGWQGRFRIGDQGGSIIALGGGGLAFF